MQYPWAGGICFDVYIYVTDQNQYYTFNVYSYEDQEPWDTDLKFPRVDPRTPKDDFIPSTADGNQDYMKAYINQVRPKNTEIHYLRTNTMFGYLNKPLKTWNVVLRTT